MVAKDVYVISKGRIKESDVHSIKQFGGTTLITTDTGIYKLKENSMSKVANRYLRDRSLVEEAARFVVVQQGDDDYDEYYLTSKGTLTPDPFDKDIKFCTSEEQARAFAVKSYVPEFLSEIEFEFAISGDDPVIELRETSASELQKELGPIFLEKTGASVPEKGEDFDDDMDDTLDEGDDVEGEGQEPFDEDFEEDQPVEEEEE